MDLKKNEASFSANIILWKKIIQKCLKNETENTP